MIEIEIALGGLLDVICFARGKRLALSFHKGMEMCSCLSIGFDKVAVIKIVLRLIDLIGLMNFRASSVRVEV